VQKVSSHSRHSAPILLLVLLAIVFAGCGETDRTGEFYTDWDIAGGCVSGLPGAVRRDGNNAASDFCDLAPGGWIWVTYAAEWCPASRNQAAPAARFARTVRGRLDVFTVLTSGAEPFTVARLGEVRAWASRHGIASTHILFGTEPDSRVIPQHLLIGPDGRTWFRYIGQLQTEEMLHIFQEFESGLRRPDLHAKP
jgi:hypothetical protein